ncbi:MAG: 4-hydroxybenzoate octaprenyltransferase [Gammaproteobacteria bacterium]|nr:4-hydroxybenzoate octaprenyltransferase [Gammaproteobacteria bacterium]
MRSYLVKIYKQTRLKLAQALHWLNQTQKRIRASQRYLFLTDRLIQYGYLCRLHKRIGVYLLLWPTLWALWIAGDGKPDPLILFVFISGTVLMRSAGCAINDVADRQFDAYVTRTKDRPLVIGTVKPVEAIGVFVVLSLLAFALVILTNELTVKLAFAGLALTILYPFAKRFTYMPQMILGAAFAWAVPMVFAAQTGEIPLIAWLLYTATLLWTVAYDTMYAMVDREDDLKIGVKSTAILFGEADVVITMFLQGLTLLALLLAGKQLQFSIWYYAGLLAAAGLMIYQYRLIRRRQPADCFKAFLNNHLVGMAVFAGLLIHYLTVIFGAVEVS